MDRKAIDELSEEYTIIFFDGLCNFCNSFINLLLRIDKKGLLRFSPLQSEMGQEISNELKLNPTPETVVALKNRQLYTNSDVTLQIIRSLGGGWRILEPIFLLPKGFRDSIYQIIAKNRYAWFGKREACRIPTPEERDRFI